MDSREVKALIDCVAGVGLPHRVTSTTGGTHAPTSRHHQMGTDGDGLAADFAGPTWMDVPAMLAIYRLFLERADQLHELIFWVPGEVKTLVRRRVKVVPTVYGVKTLEAHRNHVHVSVDRGVFLAPPQGVKPMFDPPLVLEPIVAELVCPTGGVWLLADSGAVYAFGGAPYLGAPNGRPYWGDRKAARLELVNSAYRVVAASGEGYGPGFDG